MFPWTKKKRCIQCKELKGRKYFHRMLLAKDGLQPRCKSCNNERSKAWYKRNRHKYTNQRSSHTPGYRKYDQVDEKACTQCGRVQVMEAFHYAHVRVRDGSRARSAQCKDCHNAYQLAWYQRNKDRLKEARRSKKLPNNQ